MTGIEEVKGEPFSTWGQFFGTQKRVLLLKYRYPVTTHSSLAISGTGPLIQCTGTPSHTSTPLLTLRTVSRRAIPYILHQLRPSHTAVVDRYTALPVQVPRAVRVLKRHTLPVERREGNGQVM